MKDFTANIRIKLSQIHKNAWAHEHMQPNFRGKWIQTEPARKSAVLIIIFPKYNELHIIYTKRTTNKNDKHSGQISFPGGKFDEPDSNLQHTAIRETLEEIGIAIAPELIVGTLSEIHIPVSNFDVQPFVAILNKAPQNYKLEIAEIAEILEVPLSHLHSLENRKTKIITHKNQEITIPFYAWKEHEIWGATAMITAELLEILKNKI
jgi:8-oxo-dGTP pyrophosphatase MutT (NUDIX family)